MNEDIIIEELIKFETAILAKEKGFDLYVSNYYMNDYLLNGKSFSRMGKSNYNQDGLQIWDDNTLIYYSAPTQALLQRWLREVHNINVNSNVNFYNKHKKLGYYYTIDRFDANDIHDGKDYDLNQMGLIGDKEGFKTYEEAMEVGLYEALKLIP